MSSDLDLAQIAVRSAVDAGATSADALLVESRGTSVRVRDGETEKVQDSHSRSLGVRAFVDGRVGIAYTNDATEGAVRIAARRAAALAEVSADDPNAGLPDPSELGSLDAELDVVDAGAAAWTADAWRELGLAAESAARADERITQSEGARAGGVTSHIAIANSAGFAGERSRTDCYVYVSVFATGEKGERQRDGYSSAAAHLSDLESAGDVGREAARRAIQRCGYRKPPTGAFPVILSPDVARDFAHTLADAVSAAAVFRRGTFLADSLGETVGSSALTLVDDGTLPRRQGSRAFDGEGVRSRRTVLFDAGRLASWLADSYSGRRTESSTTGNASRGTTGSPGVGTSNLVLAAGDRTPEQVIGDVPQGLYITELFGMGVNLAAGSWSRGGGGLWIEDGKLSYPVQELTVAGDLRTMLKGVAETANDLTWHGSTAAPTTRIDGLTVAAG